MARNFSPFVCLTVMIMDVVAGILGIQAEIAQNEVKQFKALIFECRDPSYEAFKLGLAAAVLLSLSHVFTNLLGGCICMGSKSEYERASANKLLAVIFLILSWVVLGAAFPLLVIGTLANSKSRKYCGIAYHRFLSIGGILCFIHGFFSVAYYVSTVVMRKEVMKKTMQGGQTGGTSTA